MNVRVRDGVIMAGRLAAISVMAGLVSTSHATMVLWYGKACTDEAGAVLKDGALAQLIRSPDGIAGKPDSVTGAPTGNDTVCATTKYECAGPAECHFQGEDWNEAENYYVFVRIWNASDAGSGTCYWDSETYPAAGMLPIDIDCAGAKIIQRK